MSVGKNSISRASGAKVAPAAAPAAAPAVEAPVQPAAPAPKKAPAKKASASEKPVRHGNYVMITEELPVWLL
ncbi:MAG: hypothetical protein IJU20_06115 [Clostridia bacterium]|nr:hypothetical protein [Clostridia bacterium]